MNNYIGTKMVSAEPATYGEAWLKKQNLTHEMIADHPEFKKQVECRNEPGYRVIYEDGYESWSPKDVFEKSYLLVSVNSALRTDAPSISQEMVDDFIANYEVMTMGEKTTVVRAVLKNGFEIVESSACVSAANYDESLGAEICLEKVKDKVWMLLGFLLQTAVHGVGGYNE